MVRIAPDGTLLGLRVHAAVLKARRNSGRIASICSVRTTAAQASEHALGMLPRTTRILCYWERLLHAKLRER